MDTAVITRVEMLVMMLIDRQAGVATVADLTRYEGLDQELATRALQRLAERVWVASEAPHGFVRWYLTELGAGEFRLLYLERAPFGLEEVSLSDPVTGDELGLAGTL